MLTLSRTQSNTHLSPLTPLWLVHSFNSIISIAQIKIVGSLSCPEQVVNFLLGQSFAEISTFQLLDKDIHIFSELLLILEFFSIDVGLQLAFSNLPQGLSS